MSPVARLGALARRELWLLIAFAVAAAALFLLLRINAEIAEGETIGLDRALLLYFRDAADPARMIGPPGLALAVRDITALGGATLLTLLTLLAAGYLVAARRHATALFLVLAVSGGATASTLLKLAFARARPDLVAHLVDVHSASFPSGHAMNSAVTYLTLGVLLARAERSPRVKAYLIGAALALTLTVGSTRVMLGVHWPTDVLAGWVVGGAWAIGCWALAVRLQRRHVIEAAPDGEGAPTSDARAARDDATSTGA